MDRTAYNALLAQYRVRELTGDGAVNWEDGVHCVIPEVNLYGKCGQDGVPTPETPVEIKCNNGTFVINGKNIFNFVPFVDAGYFSVDDEESGECTIIRTDSFPSVPVNAMKNTQYCITFEFQGVLDGQNVIMVVNYTDGTSQSIGGSTDVSQFVTVQALTSANKTIKSISFGASGGIRTGTKLQKVQIEASQAPTPYAPYFDGGTAQAPDLYGIPGTDYRDEWDAQTGQGVRRCAIIESYAGETITTPYISSTGELSDGATVIYGIPDTPFYATPARLTMPPGYGQIIQTGGDVADCPLAVRYLGHQ